MMLEPPQLPNKQPFQRPVEDSWAGADLEHPTSPTSACFLLHLGLRHLLKAGGADATALPGEAGQLRPAQSRGSWALGYTASLTSLQLARHKGLPGAKRGNS